VGNGARYRVKDFAAFYLGRILSCPVPFHEEVAGRDGEIARLLATIDAGVSGCAR